MQNKEMGSLQIVVWACHVQIGCAIDADMGRFQEVQVQVWAGYTGMSLGVLCFHVVIVRRGQTLPSFLGKGKNETTACTTELQRDKMTVQMLKWRSLDPIDVISDKIRTHNHH